MWLYHHQPITGVCEHSSFFSHQNNPDSHKEHKEPPQKLLQACTAQWVSNTPVPALGAALRTGMSSPKGIPGLRSSVGVIFCWLTAEFYSTLNATVHCCRVQQLFQTPTFPTCSQTGVTWQSTSTVAKQTWLQFQNLPGAFLPSVLFIFLSLSWKKALHSYQK